MPKITECHLCFKDDLPTWMTKPSALLTVHKIQKIQRNHLQHDIVSHTTKKNENSGCPMKFHIFSPFKGRPTTLKFHQFSLPPWCPGAGTARPWPWPWPWPPVAMSSWLPRRPAGARLRSAVAQRGGTGWRCWRRLWGHPHRRHRMLGD